MFIYGLTCYLYKLLKIKNEVVQCFTLIFIFFIWFNLHQIIFIFCVLLFEFSFMFLTFCNESFGDFIKLWLKIYNFHIILFQMNIFSLLLCISRYYSSFSWFLVYMNNWVLLLIFFFVVPYAYFITHLLFIFFNCF